LEEWKIMRKTQDKTADVLIVGAGPTGLMMACQLAIHKISFRIIDKKADLSKNSGALILQARSLEIFDQMGIATEAIKAGIIADKVNFLFNGKKISSIAIKDIGADHSRFPFLLMLEQSKTEKLFLGFISDRGYAIERGAIFKSLIQEKGGVTSKVIFQDGTEQYIKTKYVIAADGANSTTRDFLNIPFKGKTYPKPLFILDCKATTDLNPGEIYFNFSKASVAGFFPLHGSRWRIDSNLPKETENSDIITFDRIERDFHLWTKMNLTFHGYEWFSVSHAHQKYAGAVRLQNCFIAGDAAHVNTPVGAQGMNTGLQDAFNLAWKLAFVIRHKVKQELLDTYSMERSGISKGFAHYADAVFKLVTSKNAGIIFFRFYLLGLIFKVLLPLLVKRSALRLKFFKSISQIGIHYHDSMLSYKAAKGEFLKGAPRPGDRLPFVEYFYKGRKTNNYILLAVEKFNLFVFAFELPQDIAKLAGNYDLAVQLIDCMPETIKIYESLGGINTGYCLIRPDHYIALLSGTLNIRYLEDYLKKFLIIK